MKKSTVIILLAIGLVPVFPVGLDNNRVSLLQWLWRHTVWGPDFDMVPEENYLIAFETAYGDNDDEE